MSSGPFTFTITPSHLRPAIWVLGVGLCVGFKQDRYTGYYFSHIYQSEPRSAVRIIDTSTPSTSTIEVRVLLKVSFCLSVTLYLLVGAITYPQQRQSRKNRRFPSTTSQGTAKTITQGAPSKYLVVKSLEYCNRRCDRVRFEHLRIPRQRRKYGKFFGFGL